MTEPAPGMWPEGTAGCVVIVGLGVMGGSVAKSLKRREPGARISGIDPDDESAALAAQDGIARVRRLEDCDPEGGIVVFAAPLEVTVALVGDTAATWSRAALATDVASLKVPVIEAARRGTGHGAAFVGAHPMCGSERSGYAAAREDLFEGADVWLCPARESGEPGAASAAEDRDPAGGDGAGTAPSVGRASAFWRLLGARPRTIAAERHDRTMAWASHLPQLLSSALAASLDDAGLARELLGPGGRDMTRLAGSGAEMWLPLLEAARHRDAQALRAVEERIASLRRMLDEGDTAELARLMDRGRRWVAAKD